MCASKVLRTPTLHTVYAYYCCVRLLLLCTVYCCVLLCTVCTVSAYHCCVRLLCTLCTPTTAVYCVTCVLLCTVYCCVLCVLCTPTTAVYAYFAHCDHQPTSCVDKASIPFPSRPTIGFKTVKRFVPPSYAFHTRVRAPHPQRAFTHDHAHNDQHPGLHALVILTNCCLSPAHCVHQPAGHICGVAAHPLLSMLFSLLLRSGHKERVHLK